MKKTASAKTNKTKITISIVKQTLSWIIVVLSVVMALCMIFSLSTSQENGYQLFGYRFYIVRTDSMSKTHFSAGDLVICKQVDVDTLKQGDVITFVSDSVYSYGQTLTHKIKKVTHDVHGNIAFETYGTTTGKSDDALATKVLGIYVGKIDGLGNFLAFLKTPWGYFLFVFLPFASIITLQAINCIKLVKKLDENQGKNS